MINIILCGGSGTRLWPLSRTALPKQFVKLFEGCSLFQETLKRNKELCHHHFVISNIEQYFLAIDQAEEVGANQCSYLLEPIGRNTAPAIALACLACDIDDLVFVTPADHRIHHQTAYNEAVSQAKALALQDRLVVFGIQPTYAETGFGYIQAQGNQVLSFTEKPDSATALAYLEQGCYYWNAGMFCFKAGVFLAELKQYAPDIYQACISAHQNALLDHQVTKIVLADMQSIPEDSIDYAVLEKSDKVSVVPCDIDWSDLGSFDALYQEVKRQQGDVSNAVLMRHAFTPEPVCIDAVNNLIVSRDRQISLVDVEDLLIVDTVDALLIAKKGSSQKIKQALSQVKRTQPELAQSHHLTHRPWGSYEVLVNAQGYKVKRIVVKPNASLSLQKHFHRNEHWVVVSGTATVTVDDKVFLVRPNESTYIQMGQMHRLENQGKIDLIMIEVQVGEYTGEDDIVRIDDIYGR
ncbi:MAG: mannose-1-phosphate guanylyltransferase/mannose-6-phosphate isomerase [Gammaproteobacteria bacterium]|nr:mannose-1-phosphate guanylyltransferase/mannose-6-phosphate isomerase [Gammaproteobacteria bacterium]